jgi:hypothetical protein
LKDTAAGETPRDTGDAGDATAPDDEKGTPKMARPRAAAKKAPRGAARKNGESKPEVQGEPEPEV